ncbi:TauD/TfdA family dioxygenase [Mycolicibacterium rufum]|uniref:TauD/TfdA family dioxygenase n=1 Tax=Mycolicibacterium rufum TaxID=318424 RepID=A0A9X3BRT3_9MYCO|nr:TauD/TfdA family dioxygenase [Mycolicibacterium rufum]KGI66276.1 dioxygenase [Mycolicibacterium rufum]MCV7072610.1 TauD/TfdA family dioxygenase [Mycolicibacterium rufum]ULP37026.1 TauD/TfdA family dioxygenase [Mycolicibacterium rufum]
MTIEVTTRHPIGARIRGVRVGPLDPTVVAHLRALLAVHGVLVLPDQRVDDADFARFLQSFGELVFTTGETPVPHAPLLNVITNVGRTRAPRSSFHVDTSYLRCPPAYTALRAVTVPERGGQTLFTNQYHAYDTLPREMQARIRNRVVTHVVTGLDLDEGAETSARHPLVLRHPLSGRTALYLSTRQRCREVSGMAPEAAEQLIDELLEHSTRQDNVFRHQWQPDDVVIWDNRCVMHRADHDGVVGDRVMHRGTVVDRTAWG